MKKLMLISLVVLSTVNVQARRYNKEAVILPSNHFLPTGEAQPIEETVPPTDEEIILPVPITEATFDFGSNDIAIEPPVDPIYPIYMTLPPCTENAIHSQEGNFNLADDVMIRCEPTKELSRKKSVECEGSVNFHFNSDIYSSDFDFRGEGPTSSDAIAKAFVTSGNQLGTQLMPAIKNVCRGNPSLTGSSMGSCHTKTQIYYKNGFVDVLYSASSDSKHEFSCQYQQ